MIREISRILFSFRSCFTRTAAFNWFVLLVYGFIVRVDVCGASSFIRWLGIKPKLYTAMLSFFRASSWNLSDILAGWVKKLFCVPLCAELHEGITLLRKIQNKAQLDDPKSASPA